MKKHRKDTNSLFTSKVLLIAFTIIISVIFLGSIAYSQTREFKSIKGVIFKDGSVLHGQIVEMNASIVKIQTPDGNVHVRKYDDVKSFIKDVMEKPRKQVEPQILAKRWTETIRAEQEREWILYAKSQDGLLFHYNPASLSVVDQRYVYFRDQVKYPADWTKDLSYVWRSVKVNCADKMFKLSDFVALNKAGKPTDPKVSETVWANLPEQSPLGTFAFKMCHEKIK